MTTGNPFVLTRDGITFPDDPEEIAALKKRMVDHIAETTMKYQQLKEVCDLLDHLEQFEHSLTDKRFRDAVKRERAELGMLAN
jgi:hypothetical protein